MNVLDDRALCIAPLQCGYVRIYQVRVDILGTFGYIGYVRIYRVRLDMSGCVCVGACRGAIRKNGRVSRQAHSKSHSLNSFNKLDEAFPLSIDAFTGHFFPLIAFCQKSGFIPLSN